MPVEIANVKLALAVKAPGPGSSKPQNTPSDPTNGSLGGFVSTSQLDVTQKMNNLFDDLSGKENKDKVTDYRCLFVVNEHGTLPMKQVAAKLRKTPAGANVFLAVDPTASSAKDAPAEQALELATELDPDDKLAALQFVPVTAEVDLGEIPAGQVRAVWIKRTADASPPINSDELILDVEWDTAA